MRILARMTEGKPYKKSYMKIVDDLETEDEIIINRLKIKKYLRELLYNQKRIIEDSKKGPW